MVVAAFTAGLVIVANVVFVVVLVVLVMLVVLVVVLVVLLVLVLVVLVVVLLVLMVLLVLVVVVLVVVAASIILVGIAPNAASAEGVENPVHALQFSQIEPWDDTDVVVVVESASGILSSTRIVELELVTADVTIVVLLTEARAGAGLELRGTGRNSSISPDPEFKSESSPAPKAARALDSNAVSPVVSRFVISTIASPFFEVSLTSAAANLAVKPLGSGMVDVVVVAMLGSQTDLGSIPASKKASRKVISVSRPPEFWFEPAPAKFCPLSGFDASSLPTSAKSDSICPSKDASVGRLRVLKLVVALVLVVIFGAGMKMVNMLEVVVVVIVVAEVLELAHTTPSHESRASFADVQAVH